MTYAILLGLETWLLLVSVVHALYWYGRAWGLS